MSLAGTILLLGKPSLDFVFRPPFFLGRFFVPFRSPRHHLYGELDELGEQREFVSCWWHAELKGDQNRRKLSGTTSWIVSGRFIPEERTWVTSSSEMEKHEKQGGVMKGMKPMHAPSWRVWIERFGLWEDVSLIYPRCFMELEDLPIDLPWKPAIPQGKYNIHGYFHGRSGSSKFMDYRKLCSAHQCAKLVFSAWRIIPGIVTSHEVWRIWKGSHNPS